MAHTGMAAKDIAAAKSAIPRHALNILSLLVSSIRWTQGKGVGFLGQPWPKMASRRFSARLYWLLARLLMCGVGIRGADQKFAGNQFPGVKLCAEDADLLALLHVAHIDSLGSMLVLGLVIQRDLHWTCRGLELHLAGGDGNNFADRGFAFVQTGVMGAERGREQRDRQNG